MAWSLHTTIGTLLVYAYVLSGTATESRAITTLVYNDVKNCQFCQVCQAGPAVKGPCITVQSGESTELDADQLSLYGYYVSCPIGLSRASDVERTLLEGLLKSDDLNLEIISLNEHLSSVAKVHIVTDGDDPTQVLRLVNPKFPDSDS